MWKILLRHILIKTKLTFLLTPYLYTFSLYENPSFIIFSAETEYISRRYWLSWSHHFESCDLVDSYGISVTNDHAYVQLLVITSLSCSRAWLVTRFVTRLTRRLPLVEQELLSLPEHMSFIHINASTIIDKYTIGLTIKT